MAFPVSPTDGQQHAEAGITYTYVAASNLWQKNGISVTDGDPNPITSGMVIGFLVGIPLMFFLFWLLL